MRARVAYILIMDEPAQKELWASYLPTRKLPRQPDNAFENNICALMLGHGQTFLTLSTAGNEAGWERGGRSFPQLSLVFHCLRKKLPNVDLSTPVLPGRLATLFRHLISDGKLPGGEKGHCPAGLCKHKKSSAELHTAPVLPGATRPSQSPGRQAGTEPQGLLALTTTRCLLQTS